MLNHNVIDNGFSFLKREQKPDGHFVGQTSIENNFSTTKTSDTVFLTSLILSCLNSLKTDPNLDNIKSCAVKFLLKQRSEHWSFNYWKKGSDEAKNRPYPDDLDDTFCALIAINNYDKDILDGEAFANITTVLTATEKQVGGPYRTWIVPPDAKDVWKDTDTAVNGNIAYFLAQQDIFLPNTRKFLLEAIIKKNLSSKYYPTVFPIAYFLSRFLNLDRKVPTKFKKSLQKIILSKQTKNGSFGNPLHTALAVSSLLRLGIAPKMVERSIEYLYQTSEKGTWPAYAFCCDPVINKKQYYAGSKALTTAFCLEALSLFDAHTVNIPSQNSKTDNKAQTIYNQVVKRARKRFTKLDKDLQSVALKMLEKTIKGDKDKQIVLMPYYFTLALGKRGTKISRDFLISLGLANIYGWIAYRIYDDFFDEEGKPAQLSLANVCLRELTAIYSSIIPKKFREVMDTLDSANAWEIAHCRFAPKHFPPENIPDFKDFSQLANKSIGHALGPLAILIKLGYNANSKEIKQFLSFFRHYIIARQLNDDAHDWEEDLARGQINAVGAKILRKTKVKSKLQEVFWQDVFEDVAATILSHVNQARKSLPTMEDLLIPIENSIQKGLKERKDSISFLKTYSK